MTIVTEPLWRFWMGDMPMPEDCEHETMHVMYESIKKIDDREYAARQVKWYQEEWRKRLPAYKQNPNDETQRSIMKLIKEGIMYWREVLSDD